ncbi:hypothetical protein OG552_10650 [Streptomyces sp. NBC_01476]|uniref:hypothetical protein n=1 Tax=Streptomyces sp. NBC_01476 TaxID=2903881 RepID=UPI002E32BB35|nr:hypothetical protein [Streptomyces sp. NBC_01476]
MNATDMWTTAIEMDELATQRTVAWHAKHPDSTVGGEQTYDVVATRDFATHCRTAALIATVDGPVATMEGWILAPHPLMVRCTRFAVSVTTQSQRHFAAEVDDLPGTAAALLRIAAEAALACTSQSGHCDDCAKWASSIPAA